MLNDDEYEYVFSLMFVRCRGFLARKNLEKVNGDNGEDQ
jgi:hypothetical protein